MLQSAKKRAVLAGVPFDLSPEDIVIPEICPVLGIRLEIQFGKRGFAACSPSLDRLVPSRGYVRGNVAVISGRANLLKRDATVDELERIASWMRSMGVS